MTAPRARFHFISDCLDAKTTIVKVLTVQLEKEDTIFQFPTEYQLKEHHRKLFDTSVVRNVMKSMKTRGNFRNVWITLINELKDNYLDEEGNVCFKGLYLDGAQACVDPNPTAPYIPKSETFENKSLHSMVKDMILDKFSGRNQNAKIFLELFVQECNRLRIGNPHFPQVLKVFLEGPALDWFLAFLRTHTLSYPWEFWQNSFLDTFSEIGWDEINYAYTFRYISGPMLDYALKKRNLLIDADPELTLNSQINFIVLGLPAQIRSRLSKRDLNSIDILMSHVRQLEGLINNKNTSAIEHKRQLQFSNRSVSEPCPHCEKIGFPNRFHSEHLCRNRTNSKQKFKNDKIKMVNNLEVQDSISSSDESKKRITTPLIKLRVLVDNCPVIALYDSGANISVIPILLAHECATVVAEGKKLITTSLSYLNILSMKYKTYEDELVLKCLSILCHQGEMRVPQFTAGGFFKIDYTMLGMIIGCLTTNMMMILQFAQNDRNMSCKLENKEVDHE
ncbi:hypothetical protein WA026_002927 [Henosepilachna vigintioctopunctata]|uniref:Gustatory receptor n=1 Tax=Henosepilachna vigintioctopunctata TaxID=420089 RepID=A0AAW1TLN0_9CUCU